MNPAKYPHRKSLRLPNFDYSTAGAYFVTICVRHWVCLFEPLPVHNMIQKWWDELPQKYPSVEIGEFVVMPNHIHGIITLTEPDVWADLCVDPNHPGGSANQPPVPTCVSALSAMWIPMPRADTQVRPYPWLHCPELSSGIKP